MHTSNEQVLFICSPSKTLQTLEEALLAKFLCPITAMTVREAELILAQTPIALIVCASELIDGTYRDVLRMPDRVHRTVPVIVVSMMARKGECEEARRLGAVDCIPRPMTLGDMQSLADKAQQLISHRPKPGNP